MTIAVVKFPGTSSEKDVVRALSLIPGASPYIVNSKQGADALAGADGLIIPSGMAYENYVHAGVEETIQTMMDGIKEIADSGKPVIGIGNGVQILMKFKLLPGVLKRNKSGRFLCKWGYLRVCNEPTIFTEELQGAVIRVPIAIREGRFHYSKSELENLISRGGVISRFCDKSGERTPEANLTGSIDNIAGILNNKGNVLGFIAHPERATRPELSSSDGLLLLESFVRATRRR